MLGTLGTTSQILDKCLTDFRRVREHIVIMLFQTQTQRNTINSNNVIHRKANQLQSLSALPSQAAEHAPAETRCQSKPHWQQECQSNPYRRAVLEAELMQRGQGR